MLADRHRLRRRLDGLRREAQTGQNVEGGLARLGQVLQASIDRVRQRRSEMPKVRYDQELPVAVRRREIADAVRSHPVVIVCGETGCGKSTQLPKICLELGRGAAGLIGHTQPRRIAARAVAARVAEELRVPLGQQVGFKIRFTDVTSPETCVKLMTDGILLAETQGDRFLEQYDTIILDEAHERSLNIDFLVGYLKRLLTRRADLKLIITSATIDVGRFARHFASPAGPAPVIELSDRTYPVEVRYRPVAEEEDHGEGDWGEGDWIESVGEAVDELCGEGPGDLLVFMPTERDIHETAKVLRGHLISGDAAGRPVEILPLYGRLPGAQQQRIFQPSKRRRIVIATNVAESSLTVPRVRYVIDPGTARISRYSARSKTQRLPIEPISQASAEQRMGRCGRIGPGTCVRLYSEADFLGRPRFTPPEIQRSNLAAVILQAKSLRLGKLERFPFLDPPKRAAVSDGVKTLFELGAIDRREELTATGRSLARLPVDPRIGRMVLAGDEHGCLSEVLIIASALEIRDPRERPVERRQAADECHGKFAHQDSDFLTYLNLWDFYDGLRRKLSRGQLRKACRQNFLSQNRMREWVDIHRQLSALSEDAGMKPRRRRGEYEPIHRAILTGLLSNVACRLGTYEYTGAGGNKSYLWPGSTTFDARPKWIVAAEQVETTKRYLRTCARIDPDWIEPAAAHLVHRSFGEYHWDASGGSAMAYERVSLFGLIVVPRRRVALGPIDPAAARELLIRHGLVEGRLPRRPGFVQRNLALAAELELLERKLRRRDLVCDESTQLEFYDRRVPEDVYDAARLETWQRRVQGDHDAMLTMTREDLLQQLDEPPDAAGFPDTLDTGRQQLPLDYRFEPGSEDDGVHVVVPHDAVGQLRVEHLQWLVPGLCEQKVTALIKSLPKPLRTKLVPAPDTAKRVAAGLRFGDGSMISAVAAALTRIAGAQIAPEDFRLDRLPPELQMNVRVVDEKGEVIAGGRDLDGVRRQLGELVCESLAEIDDPRWNRDGLTGWDFDELPEQVEVRRGQLTLRCHPMLVDMGESVSLRLSDSPQQAQWQSRRALVRLFALAAGGEIRGQLRWFPDLEKMLLRASLLPEFDLRGELAELIASRALRPEEAIPRRRAEYDARVSQSRERIGLAVQEISPVLPPLWESFYEARLAVERADSPRWQYAVEDVREQVDHLTAPGFLTRTSWQWLQQYARYFRAICVRMDRLRGGGLQRDREACDEIRNSWQACQERLEQHRSRRVHDPELEHFRWMLEEYRVSLFAQNLGTSLSVSSRRLDRQWEKVGP